MKLWKSDVERHDTKMYTFWLLITYVVFFVFGKIDLIGIKIDLGIIYKI